VVAYHKKDPDISGVVLSKEILEEWEVMEWVDVIQDIAELRVLVNMKMNGLSGSKTIFLLLMGLLKQ
jgi:hypothetical protein